MYFNCHTYYSFKYGTLSVEQLFEEARRCGIKKLILTDINNTAAYIEMLRVCRENREKYDLEIAVGIEFHQDDRLQFIALARNNKGFEHINGYLSHLNNEKRPVAARAPELDQVYIIYPLHAHDPEVLRPYEFIGIKPHELNRLTTARERLFPHKLVAWQPVTFANKKGYNIHRLSRAIARNTLLSMLDPVYQARPDEIMRPPTEIQYLYRYHEPLLTNAQRIVDECKLTLTLGTSKNKKHYGNSKAEDLQQLQKKAEAGFQWRYGTRTMNDIYRERFDRELEIIAHKGFEAYYLIAEDIINYARHKNYAYVGRGSGANSLIAYCLGITNVDPIELDLYFERFLNPERSSPPDFDLDFSWQDRDDITRYIFDTYHQKHTALLGTHTTYRGRSVIRELGKVFGLPKAEIDKIVTYPDEYNHQDDITRLIFQYGRAMLGMPNNLSIHAGGILITEAPIYAYTATDRPPKDFPVAHFEMHNAEDMGIYKLDILSQRGLGHIKDAAALVEQNQGIKVNTEDFQQFKKDPKIRELLRTGHTMGCFYVESPAMRMLLGKLSCDNYITLVAASSIIRPGVARSGMMRAYIERHHLVTTGKTYESIHPKMDELMAETYGVMVYQEDVIKVAHHFAQISLSEADILRRGMSGKFRSRKEFKRVEDRYFENCRSIGYEPHVIDRVWYEIESFSGYSFSKGHSASYAVESYQSLYLKAHYPLEFMVGVINNFGGFYKTEFYFHEARMEGASIEAPCINKSNYLTTIEGTCIYIGFIHLKSLETKIGQQIEKERRRNGWYTSLDNFIRRVPMGLEQVLILIKIGALRFTGQSKKELMWSAHLYFGVSKGTSRYTTDMFNEAPPSYSMPVLSHHTIEDAFDQLELLGFPLCDPFDLLPAPQPGDTVARDLILKLGKRVDIVGYIVTTKDTSTKDGNRMHFGTFYDYQGHVFDTVHFPPVAKKYPFRGKGFYRIVGKVVEDFGYPMIETDFMEKLPMINRQEYIAKKEALA